MCVNVKVVEGDINVWGTKILFDLKFSNILGQKTNKVKYTRMMKRSESI